MCGLGPRLSLSRSFPSQGRRQTGRPPSRSARPLSEWCRRFRAARCRCTPSTSRTRRPGGRRCDDYLPLSRPPSFPTPDPQCQAPVVRPARPLSEWCCRAPAARRRCTPSTSRTRRPGGRRNGMSPLLFRWRCDWPPAARREGRTPSHSGRLPCGLRSRAPVVRSCCTPSTSQVPVRTSHTRACDFRSKISPPRRRDSRSSARTPLARCSSRGRRSRLARAP